MRLLCDHLPHAKCLTKFAWDLGAPHTGCISSASIPSPLQDRPIIAAHCAFKIPAATRYPFSRKRGWILNAMANWFAVLISSSSAFHPSGQIHPQPSLYRWSMRYLPSNKFAAIVLPSRQIVQRPKFRRLCEVRGPSQKLTKRSSIVPCDVSC